MTPEQYADEIVPRIIERAVSITSKTEDVYRIAKKEVISAIVDAIRCSEVERCQRCKGRGWYLARFSDNHGTSCADCGGTGVIVHVEAKK
jgi:DnaJ-class molecular chaperone